MIDYLVGIGAVLIVICVGYRFIKQSRSGKSKCDCGCNGCPSQNKCNNR